MSQRGLLISLFASAALNLFLIGGAVGGLVISEKYAASASPVSARRPGLGRAGDSLPEAERVAYRAVIKAQGPQSADQNREARRLRRAVWSSLKSGSFDADAARRQLADARALEVDARTRMEDQVVSFAATLSQPSRAALAEGLEATVPAEPTAATRKPDHRP